MCIYSKSREMLKQLNELEAEAAVRAASNPLGMSPMETIIHYQAVLLALIQLWEAVRKVFFWKRSRSSVPRELVQAINSLPNVNKSAE